MTECQWWQAVTEDHEVSVEADFGHDLGIKLGDELGFDIAGEPVLATVTSFRTVEWDTFQPNFFMFFSTATLRDYPATYITALYATAEDDRKILELMRQFPSVTVIDLEA